MPATKRKSPQQKRTTLRNKADSLWSQIIRARDGACVRCGKTEILEAAHVWGRRYMGTRFDELNGVALDKGCHVYFTHNPFEWYEFMEQRLGKREWVLLRERALFGAKPQYDEIIPRLQARLEELEA
jgi:hypothetical protein